MPETILRNAAYTIAQRGQARDTGGGKERTMAAAVATERSIDTEIGQQIKQAVVDALRGTAKEGEK